MTIKLKCYSVLLSTASITLVGCQTTEIASPKTTPQDENIRTMQAEDTDSDGDGVLDQIDYCPKTPTNVAVDELGCPMLDDSVDYITMELRVFFERNSNELQTKYLSEVKKIAEKMHSNSKLVVVLSGHISEPEANQISLDINKKMNQAKVYKLQLGHERAQIIKNALINRGVAADKIYSFDCADNMPIAPNDNEEGASMNQRIYGKTETVNGFYASKDNGNMHSFQNYQAICHQF